jgi:hypothetical protein
MLSVSASVAVVWHWVGRIVLVWTQQLSRVSLLKFDNVYMAKNLGHGDHFFRNFEGSLVIAADLGHDRGSTSFIHRAFAKSSRDSRSAPAPPEWLGMYAPEIGFTRGA